MNLRRTIPGENPDGTGRKRRPGLTVQPRPLLLPMLMENAYPGFSRIDCYASGNFPDWQATQCL